MVLLGVIIDTDFAHRTSRGAYFRTERGVRERGVLRGANHRRTSTTQQSDQKNPSQYDFTLFFSRRGIRSSFDFRFLFHHNDFTTHVQQTHLERRVPSRE